MKKVVKIKSIKDYLENCKRGSKAIITSSEGQKITIVELSYGNESSAIYFHDAKARGKYVLEDEYSLESLKDLNLVLMFVYKPFNHKVTNVGLNPFKTKEEFVELLEDIEISKELLNSMENVKTYYEKASNFEEKKAWTIPVSWEMYGEVDIIADTKEEALEKFRKKIDEIPLPEEAYYVDGSFVESGGNEEETLAMMSPKFKIVKTN